MTVKFWKKNLRIFFAKFRRQLPLGRYRRISQINLYPYFRTDIAINCDTNLLRGNPASDTLRFNKCKELTPFLESELLITVHLWFGIFS